MFDTGKDDELAQGDVIAVADEPTRRPPASGWASFHQLRFVVLLVHDPPQAPLGKVSIYPPLVCVARVELYIWIPLEDFSYLSPAGRLCSTALAQPVVHRAISRQRLS